MKFDGACAVCSDSIQFDGTAGSALESDTLLRELWTRL